MATYSTEEGTVERVFTNTDTRIGAVAKERSAIEAEVAKLHEALSYLDELVGILSTRVEPVSYQEPSRGEEVATSEPKGSSQFYTRVWDAVNKVERLHSLVRDITRRLEV